MTRSILMVAGSLFLLGACGKKMTVEDCKAKCVSVGDEQHKKCLAENPKEMCEEVKKKGDENCNKTCDLAFQK